MFYSLDMIIAVGKRVSSAMATAFCIWVTSILPDNRKGLASHEDAQKKAEAEYDEFNKTQKIVSDFDKEVSLFLGDKES